MLFYCRASLCTGHATANKAARYRVRTIRTFKWLRIKIIVERVLLRLDSSALIAELSTECRRAVT